METDKKENTVITRIPQKRYCPKEVAVLSQNASIRYSYNKDCTTITLSNTKYDYHVSMPNALVLEMAKSISESNL